jgi:phosphopantothenoylcysteine decarboxylase/phosphopantothenate--cysteine ligase
MSNILIGVTGGIAAYKIPSVVSVLVDKGHDVRVIMTESAKKFIAPLTFSALSHNPVYDDSKEFNGNDGHIWHVELAQWADVFAIAPMTANTGSKIHSMIADNLLTSTALVHSKPLLLFPAMNVNMWEKFYNLITESKPTSIGWYYHKKEISSKDVEESFYSNFDKKYCRILVQPDTGKMACGGIGEGKLTDTKSIVAKIEKLLTIKWGY